MVIEHEYTTQWMAASHYTTTLYAITNTELNTCRQIRRCLCQDKQLLLAKIFLLATTLN